MLAGNPFRLRGLLIAALAAAVVVQAQPVMANSEADTPAERASPVFSLRSILMQGVVNRALQHIGVPYRFGGATPRAVSIAVVLSITCIARRSALHCRALRDNSLPSEHRSLRRIFAPVISCSSIPAVLQTRTSVFIWATVASSMRRVRARSCASIVSIIRGTSIFSKEHVDSIRLRSWCPPQIRVSSRPAALRNLPSSAGCALQRATQHHQPKNPTTADSADPVSTPSRTAVPYSPAQEASAPTNNIIGKPTPMRAATPCSEV